MTPQSITCYYESKVKGKADFSSRTYGGSLTVTLDKKENLDTAYKTCWLIVQSQVIGRMIQEGLATPEEKEKKEKIDKTLNW